MDGLILSSPSDLASWSTLFLAAWPLCLAALGAGLVDSIGGGGGLITVPTLLNLGVPAPLLLGTNKCISTLGSLPAVFRYARAGLLPDLPKAQYLLLTLVAAMAAAAGALLSQQALVLSKLPLLVPILLVTVMAFLLKRWFWDEPRYRRRHLHSQPKPDVPASFAAALRRPTRRLLVWTIAAYDGLFGPGTGTFFLSCFESMGLATVSANALTKIFNLASNLGALAYFASQSRWLPSLGLLAAAAYLCGNYLGAGLVLKRGQNLVRMIVLIATSALLLRYILGLF